MPGPGEVLGDPGIPFACVGLFGYQWDNPFYYVRARYYDPVTGRWYSRDPIGRRGSGSNLFDYARNAPARWVDPSGLACTCGPEIGDAMRKLISAVGTWFNAMSDAGSEDLCGGLTGPTSFIAWGIPQIPTGQEDDFVRPYLLAGCAGSNSPCRHSVSVDGKCTYAWTVRYALYGAVNRFCYNFFNKESGKYHIPLGLTAAGLYDLDAATTNAFTWKRANFFNPLQFLLGVRYAWRDAQIAADWTRAGWNGTTNFRSPGADPELAGCSTCNSQQYLNRLEFNWRAESGDSWYINNRSGAERR